MSLTFDPYPYGCPVGFAADPEEFRALLPELVMRLVDNYHFSVHVVEPSKGQPYPLLNVMPDRDSTPCVVFFPGWEDAKRRRRVDFKRQSTLLERIHKNEVPPDKIEDMVDVAGTVLDDPLMVNFAATAPQMPQVINDLDHYLGNQMRITVQTLDARSPIPLRIVRIYAPTSEDTPRIIGFPNWRSAVARKQDELRPSDWDELLERAEVEQTPELPVEIGLG